MQTKKLRPRNIKQLPQGHTANQKSGYLNSGPLAPESGFFSGEIYRICSSFCFALTSAADALRDVGPPSTAPPRVLLCALSYETTFPSAPPPPCRYRTGNSITARSACAVTVANNSATAATFPSSTSSLSSTAPSIYCPGPPSSPCLLQALSAGRELRHRARKGLLYCHKANKWQHRILGLGHLFQVQCPFKLVPRTCS